MGNGFERNKAVQVQPKVLLCLLNIFFQTLKYGTPGPHHVSSNVHSVASHSALHLGFNKT